MELENDTKISLPAEILKLLFFNIFLTFSTKSIITNKFLPSGYLFPNVCLKFGRHDCLQFINSGCSRDTKIIKNKEY